MILLAGSVTARAFGFNVWKAVIQWTQETFHFGQWGKSDSNNSLAYTSLQEALEKGNTPTWLVPTSMPEGYTLADINVEQTPLKKRYMAIYANGEQSIRITVQDYLDKSPVFVEQSEGLVEEFEVSGITYYLLENNKRTQVVWIVDSYECRITGELTIDELKLLVNDIEKG